MKVKIICITNLSEENLFIETINKINETDKKIKFCIDFEFNKKELGLMQLYITKLNVLYLLNPDNFTIENKTILIDKIFISKNIKILHGSESNDIPYIFNKLLERKPNLISAFINNFYDTRFICSYLGFKKCNLYSALESFNIVDQDKILYLKSIENKMGVIWKIHWDPSKLNTYEKIYALYDVLLLSKLFRKQKHICKVKKLHLSRLAYALRLVLLYRQNLLNHFQIKKIENYQDYFGSILDIDYLKKLRLIL
jgi:hypothetical protein